MEKYIFWLFLFLFPIAFIPVFVNPYDPAKLLLLLVFLGLTLLIKSAKVIIKGKVEISLSGLDWTIGLFGLVYLCSGLLLTPNKMEAFFIPGVASFVIGATLVYFIANQLSSEEKKSAVDALMASAVTLAVFFLLANLGVLAKIPQLPAFIKNADFSPIGGLPTQAIFILTILPFAIYNTISHKQMLFKAFYGVCGIVLALGLGLSIVNMLPGKAQAPILPDLRTSWAVSMDSLKASPLLGIGPGNYLTAFSRFIPITYNATDLWALRFTSGRNLFLTTLSEAGLLGFVLLISIFFWIVKRLFKGPVKAAEASLLLFLLAALLFPIAAVLLIPVFAIFSLTTKTNKFSFGLTGTATEAQSKLVTRIPAVVVTLPLVAGILALGFFSYRAFLAEATFKKALDALNKNDAKATYDTLRQAITINPGVDKYRSSYGQVNLAIAGSLAQKQDLTEQDRATITQLIEQAIREAKASVALNPGRAGNWEILARTYQAIMAFATGADAFTIASFNQAVSLDPINPNLRIALGGVYFALGRYDDAIRTFELAAAAKPDLANAHYNWAIALREKGEIKKATDEMNIVLSLVGKDSADYETAKKELEKLESLTPPQPAPEPVIKPPLELPEEASPPASQ